MFTGPEYELVGKMEEGYQEAFDQGQQHMTNSGEFTEDKIPGLRAMMNQMF